MGIPLSYSKVDYALGPSTYTGASAATSPYYNMSNYERVIFIVQAGSMTASGNVAMRLLQAPSSTAPAAAIEIGTAATMNGTPTGATAITNAIEVVVKGSSQAGFAHGQSITIDNDTYTFQSSVAGAVAPTTATFAATKYVCTSSNLATPHDTIAHLAAYINHATYGTTGVTATISAATSYLTLSLSNLGAGNQTIDISVSTSNLIVYPNKMVGFLEMSVNDLSVSSSMSYVAIELTPSTDQTLSATLYRGGQMRFSEATQYVSAYDSAV